MRFSALALCLLLPAWNAAPAPAAPVVLSPFHDTWVSSAAPDTSYGVSPYLSAECTSGVTERLYMEFQTQAIAGQTITSAILTMWVVRENAGGDANDIFELFPVNSAWNDGLTWKDSLLLSIGPIVTSVPSIDYGTVNTVSPAKAVDFDITPLVQTWASGGINKGLMIRMSPNGSSDYRFASLEDPTLAIQPTLTITTAAAPPPPPPPDPDPTPAPTPTPSSSGAGGGGGSDGKCGCGSIYASWTVNVMAIAGALGLVVLAFLGRRPTIPKR
jgi:hypothetical protein